MAFTVRRTTPLSPARTWAALTDVRRHAEHVPLTRAVTDDGPPRVGWWFEMVTGVGPLAVRDRMVITVWEPTETMRVVKTGRPLAGWAELRLRPVGQGTLVEWDEELGLRLPGTARLTRAVGDRVAPTMFERVVDGVLAAAEGP